MNFKKLVATLGGLLLLILMVVLNPISKNTAGDRQVVQTVGGDLWIRWKSGYYWSGFKSTVTTWPNNVTVQSGLENKKSEEADYWTPFHTGTFAEGDQADLGHTVKWDLPNTDKEMLELHTTYNNIKNLMSTTLSLYQKETATYSTQRMSSEAHYSGGQSQLKDYFQDQLRRGQVILVTETKTEKLEDGSTKTVIDVSEKIDSNGNFVRSVSDIQKYGLWASFTSIDHVKYDPRIYEKLKAKIDAAADEATSKQRLITAEQEEKEAIVKGRKLIAETTATEEAEEQRAVIQARKAKLVAQEKAQEAKFQAQATLAIKKAEAEGDKLKVLAGLSPVEKADFEMRTRIGVAEALAKAPTPSIVVGGGDGDSDSGALSAVRLKFLMDINEKMSK